MWTVGWHYANKSSCKSSSKISNWVILVLGQKQVTNKSLAGNFERGGNHNLLNGSFSDIINQFDMDRKSERDNQNQEWMHIKVTTFLILL